MARPALSPTWGIAVAETVDVPELNEADRERFDAKVKRGEEFACWPWVGPCDAGKRPSFVTSRSAGQRRISARRLMWAMWNDTSARGQYVLSSCKNPQCMNPKHLFLSPVADGVVSTGKRAAAREARDTAVRVSAPKPPPVPESAKPTSSFSSLCAVESFDALDALNESDAEALRGEVRAAELRVQTLRALLNLAVSRPAPKVVVVEVKPPVPVPVPKKSAPKKPVSQKVAAERPSELARRLMFIARDRAPRNVAHLASLLRVTNDAVRAVCRGAAPWLACDERDQVSITDEGLAALLQQEAGRA